MHRSIRHVITAAILSVPAVAAAQPTGGPPVPPPPNPTGEATEPVDEAKVREIAAEEAKKAVEEAEAKKVTPPAETPPAETPAPESNLRGDNGFMDIRLNLTLTDENFLAKPGETIPSVPGLRFGRPNSLGTLFFDNYDTRFSGYETLSTAIMYRDYSKDHLEAEGAFVLRINEFSERGFDLSDAGSYVMVAWWKDPTRVDPTRVTLTAFPVSSDRMRLGYSYRLSWGGDPEFGLFGQRRLSSVPGVKLQYDTDKLYAFVGAKSVVVLDPETKEGTGEVSLLGGAGYDVNDKVRVEANGGIINRGNNELLDVNDQPVELFGASAQLAVHDGMPVQSSIDYKLYKNDPERVGALFTKAKYPGGLSWLAMTEATLLGQTLKDPENTGSTKIQWATAGDINVRVMKDRWRFRADTSYRDLAFILHSQPSLPSYSDFPKEYKITPDFFADAGVDHNWNDRWTLGVTAGIDMPATLVTPSGIPGDTTATGESTAVIRNNGAETLITILPHGEKAVPELALKGSAQLDFGEVYSALLDVYYVYDGNQTRLTRMGPEDELQYVFGEFNQLGMNATIQAKF